MMKVAIRTSGKAFARDKGDECGRILIELGVRLRATTPDRLKHPAKDDWFVLYDSNGEECGTCRA